MANIRDNIPAELQSELFEALAESADVTIERIVSRGQSSPAEGWYDQDRNEWVMVVQGAALLCFEYGEEISLRPGDYVNIPAHRKHRVEWTDPNQATIWLAVFY